MHITQVEVRLPELSKLRYQLWADWGPMYSFTLAPEDPLMICYNDVTVKLEQKKLRLESPMLVKRRAKYPLFFIIEDFERELIFELYLDRDDALGEVRIKKMKRDDEEEQELSLLAKIEPQNVQSGEAS